MLQQLNLVGRDRCECHECTQARWNMRVEPLNYGSADLAAGVSRQISQEYAKAKAQALSR